LSRVTKLTRNAVEKVVEVSDVRGPWLEVRERNGSGKRQKRWGPKAEKASIREDLFESLL